MIALIKSLLGMLSKLSLQMLKPRPTLVPRSGQIHVSYVDFSDSLYFYKINHIKFGISDYGIDVRRYLDRILPYSINTAKISLIRMFLNNSFPKNCSLFGIYNAIILSINQRCNSQINY